MLNGNALRDAIISGANNISNCKQRVDELNVFPVPDGDTGTNMSLTMMSAVKELAGLDTDDASAVSAAVARGALKGARGNSGVITSQILRGIAEGLVGAHSSGATPADIAAALRNGVKVEEATLDDGIWSYRCPMSRYQTLFVEVEDGTWEILRWETVTHPETPNEDLDVWKEQ